MNLFIPGEWPAPSVPFDDLSSVPAARPDPRATLDETCFVQGEHGEDGRGQRFTDRGVWGLAPILLNAITSLSMG